MRILVTIANDAGKKVEKLVKNRANPTALSMRGTAKLAPPAKLTTRSVTETAFC